MKGSRRLFSGLVVVVLAAALSGTAGAEPPIGIRLDDGSSACHFTTLSHTDLTGSSTLYTGMAEGVVVAMASPPGTMRCDVRVDGETASSTPPTHNAGILYTAGQVSFTSSDSQMVELCTVIVWDVGHPPSDSCDDSTFLGFPPQEISDSAHPDFATFDGSYSPVTGDSNPAANCHNAGVNLATTCDAGFYTPNADVCLANPTVGTRGWWSSAGRHVIFTLYLMGNGILEGSSEPTSDDVVYFMQVHVGSSSCGGVPAGQFYGHVRAI